MAREGDKPILRVLRHPTPDIDIVVSPSGDRGSNRDVEGEPDQIFSPLRDEVLLDDRPHATAVDHRIGRRLQHVLVHGREQLPPVVVRVAQPLLEERGKFGRTHGFAVL